MAAARRGGRTVSIECDVCGAPFTDCASLRAHADVHSGGHLNAVAQPCDLAAADAVAAAQPYVCEVCRAAFPVAKSLAQHVRTHPGYRPYICDSCGAAFKTLRALSGHARTHSGERPFQCDICHARFAISGNMARHRRTHNNPRRFACTVCHRRYRQEPALEEHMCKHTSGELRAIGHRGGHDSKGAAGMRAPAPLGAWFRTHVGAALYKCGACDAAFALPEHLTAHACGGEHGAATLT